MAPSQIDLMKVNIVWQERTACARYDPRLDWWGLSNDRKKPGFIIVE
jgi:hypothetical protein